MKNIGLKTLSIIGLCFIGLMTFYFGQSSLMEGKHIIDPYIDTQFAKDYTPEKFDKIKIGMTIKQVKDIIGQPIYIAQDHQDSTCTYYQYTDDGKLLSKPDANCLFGCDFAWYNSLLVINKNNVVVSIHKGWIQD